ncbi:DUF624 domain-containing protein [Bacillus sp. FJAT-49732]|uniref:DUF624 domain-containing protein n=1 Tax=Lederbergia citrisecunda TaxID=2833583 RepID=A0A942YMX3_9BACI|nr:DUF624 domain-containing protein [Lederbergia citrisecunda]MBS4201964.1 DUF624 domain-containing protein [Lederbergia citrisecunda]
MKLLNNRFYEVMETISNFFLLNLIWLFFAFPFITFFPATTSMFAILKDWKEGKHINVFSSFFTYFKKYFKQSFWAGLLFFISFSILYLDYMLIDQLNTFMRIIVLSTILLLGIILLFMSIYFFPVLVHFELRFKQTMKHAFMYSIMYFPITLISIILLVMSAVLIYLLPFLSVIAFSVIAQVIYLFCYRCFSKARSLQSQ